MEPLQLELFHYLPKWYGEAIIHTVDTLSLGSLLKSGIASDSAELLLGVNVG